MNPLALGDAIQNVNTVPGVKQRTFYAVLDNGARVSIDATNRIIIIDKSGKTGALSAAVTDTAASIGLTGNAGRTAFLGAVDDEAQMLVVGATGSINCTTALCKGKDMFPREEPWCNDAGTLRGKIMVLASAPYDVVPV